MKVYPFTFISLDGATEEQLDCEGQVADQQIPPDIRLSYRIHNGQKYGHSPGLVVNAAGKKG